MNREPTGAAFEGWTPEQARDVIEQSDQELALLQEHAENHSGTWPRDRL